jgi:hypothetical protein
MQHFVDIWQSEGFAWGALAGIAISLALDFLVAYLKQQQ